MKCTILSCIAASAVLTTSTFGLVCVVGAGPAGLTVANRLEAKEAWFTLWAPFFFSNETYRETLPIIDASGLSAIPFSNFSNGNNWLYDPESGYVQQPNQSLSIMTKTPLFQAEIDRYIKFWNTEFAPLAVVGYKNGVKGYTMSTFDWLHANDYPLLFLMFLQGMVPFGYGDVTQVPVIYMLQYFTPDILLTFTGQRSDFHRVFVTYARDHNKGPIHLNTKVAKIDRSGDFPVLSYKDHSHGPSTQKCHKLVLAFPPVMHALNAANLDLDQKETTIFSPVGIIQYWSGATRVDTPYGDIFFGFLNKNLLAIISNVAEGLGGNKTFREYIPWLPRAAGEPMGYLRIFPESDIATSWSWGKYRSNQTLGEAKSLLMEVLSKLNKDPRDPNAKPKPITGEDVVDFREWDYFPHFDGHELDHDIYARFNALQGHKSTYYASGLNGFETVEFAIRAGQDVVDTYIL